MLLAILGLDLTSFPEFQISNLKAWLARNEERPATQRGLNVPAPDQYKEVINNPEKLEEFVETVKNALFKSTEKK